MAGRLVEWLRAHPRVADLLWASPLMLFGLITTPGAIGPPAPKDINEWVHLLLSAGLTVPLVWRRRRPRIVYAVIALVSFAQWLADIPVGLVNVSVMIAFYTVAVQCTFRWGLAAALVTEFGFVLSAVDNGANLSELRNSASTTTVFIAGLLVFGVYLRTRRAYLRSVEDRADRAERERDIQVQIAMASERARIARELHDVVAHNVSVMVVQADGASFAIETDVERAKRALEAISSTGRLALSEMRRLLGVLREGDDAGSYTPQPGVEQLTDLVEQIRGAGLPLEFAVEGVPLPLPPGLQLAVFRIVQEALTNTLKHAGPEATAHVCLHYGDDAIEVRIRDDGRGAAALDDGRGHGLAGMRERAALYGGTVRAGPVAGGGFEVAARLPVPATPPPAEPGAVESGAVESGAAGSGKEAAR